MQTKLERENEELKERAYFLHRQNAQLLKEQNHLLAIIAAIRKFIDYNIVDALGLEYMASDKPMADFYMPDSLHPGDFRNCSKDDNP